MLTTIRKLFLVLFCAGQILSYVPVAFGNSVPQRQIKAEANGKVKKIQARQNYQQKKQKNFSSAPFSRFGSPLSKSKNQIPNPHSGWKRAKSNPNFLYRVQHFYNKKGALKETALIIRDLSKHKVKKIPLSGKLKSPVYISNESTNGGPHAVYMIQKPSGESEIIVQSIYSSEKTSLIPPFATDKSRIKSVQFLPNEILVTASYLLGTTEIEARYRLNSETLEVAELVFPSVHLNPNYVSGSGYGALIAGNRLFIFDASNGEDNLTFAGNFSIDENLENPVVGSIDLTQSMSSFLMVKINHNAGTQTKLLDPESGREVTINEPISNIQYTGHLAEITLLTESGNKRYMLVNLETFELLGETQEVTVSWFEQTIGLIDVSYDLDRDGAIQVSELFQLKQAFQFYYPHRFNAQNMFTPQTLQKINSFLVNAQMFDAWINFLTLSNEHERKKAAIVSLMTVFGQQRASVKGHIGPAICNQVLEYYETMPLTLKTQEEWDALGRFVGAAIVQIPGTRFQSFIDSHFFSKHQNESDDQYAERLSLLRQIQAIGKIVIYEPGILDEHLDEGHAHGYEEHLKMLAMYLVDFSRRQNVSETFYSAIAIRKPENSENIPSNIFGLSFDGSISEILLKDAKLEWENYWSIPQAYEYLFTLPWFTNLPPPKEDYAQIYVRWFTDGRALLEEALAKAVAGDITLINRVLYVGLDRIRSNLLGTSPKIFDGVTYFFDSEQNEFTSMPLNFTKVGNQIESIFLGNIRYNLYGGSGIIEYVEVQTLSMQQVVSLVEILESGNWDVVPDGIKDEKDLQLIQQAYLTFLTLGEESFSENPNVINLFRSQDKLFDFISDFNQVRLSSVAHVESALRNFQTLNQTLQNLFFGDLVEFMMTLASSTRAMNKNDGDVLGPLIDFNRVYQSEMLQTRLEDYFRTQVWTKRIDYAETEEQFLERKNLAETIWQEFRVLVLYIRESFVSNHSINGHIQNLREYLRAMQLPYPPYMDRGIVNIIQIGGQTGQGGYDAIRNRIYLQWNASYYVFIHEFGHAVDIEITENRERNITFYRTLFNEGTELGDGVSHYAMTNRDEDIAELIAYWGINSANVLNLAIGRALTDKPILLEKVLYLMNTLMPLGPDPNQVKTYRYYSIYETQNPHVELGEISVVRDLLGRVIQIDFAGTSYEVIYQESGRLQSFNLLVSATP